MHRISYDETTGLLDIEFPDYDDDEDISKISILFAGLFRRLKNLRPWVEQIIDEETDLMEKNKSRMLN